MKILIVDDDAIHRKVLRRLLVSDGHGVAEAEDGFAALQALRRATFDAVISDILMPRMDGYRLCYEIRRKPALARLPFVAYTATYTSPSDAKAALDLGADSFLGKNATPEMIRTALEEAVQARRRPCKRLRKPNRLLAMREYSEALVRKLEQTNLELAQANAALEERAALLDAGYKQLQALQEISRAVLEASELSDLLHRILERTMAIGAFDTGTICLLDPASEVLTTAAIEGFHDPYNAPKARRLEHDAGAGPIVRALLNNRIEIDENVQAAPRSRGAKREGLQAAISVPVRAGERLLGALHLGSRTARRFTAEESRLLSAIGSHVGIAVQKALLHQETEMTLSRFQAVLESALDCIIAMDHHGKIIEFNPAAEKTFGYRRADALGRDLSELIIPPALREAHRRGLARYLSTGDGPALGRCIEINAMRADGTEFPVELIVTRTSLDGLPTFTGFIRDVSERKLAEAQVQRNLERIRALHEIDIAINSTLDLTATLRVLLDKIELFIPYPSAMTVRLLNKETNQLECVAVRNVDQDEWIKAFGLAPGRLARPILETKRPMQLRNVQDDRQAKDPTLFRKYGLISYIGIPLIVKDDAIGVFNLYTKEEHEFSEEEIEFLVTLAGQAAIAIYNRHLHAQTERHLKRIEALREIENAVASSLSLERVLNVLLEKIEPFCPRFAASGVGLLEPKTGKLLPLAARNIPLDEWRRGMIKSSNRISDQLIRMKAPLAIADLAQSASPPMAAFARENGLISYLAVPLIIKDEVIGKLNIYTHEEHEFSAEETSFFTTVAGHAAIAIHNAQLFEEIGLAKKQLESSNASLEKSLRQLGALHTALAPLSAPSTEELMGGIIERLLEATGADAALIRAWQEDAQKFPVIGQRGFAEDYLRRAGGAAGGAVEWVIMHGEPIIAPDIATDPRLKGKLQLDLGYRSCAMLPVTVHGKVRGMIHLASRAPGYFDEEQKEHLSAIARQMSIAWENRDLFAEVTASRDALEQANAALSESNRMLSALHAVAATASQSLELDRVLSAALEKIGDIFDFDAAQIHLYNDATGDLHLRAAAEKEAGHFSAVKSFRKGHGIVGTVAESGTPLIFEDIESDPRYRQLSSSKVTNRFGYHFFAVFPIKSRLRNLGTLACTNQAARKLSAGELQLLESLTDQVAVAIENSDLYDRVRQKVDELQQKTAELEKANKAKGEFLAVISHELRTPLNIILGYTGLLNEQVFGTVKPEQQDILKKIEYESMELLMMIDGVLHATSLEAESPCVTEQPVDIGMLLTEIKNSCRVPVSKQLTLTWDYPVGSQTIRTDAKKLRSILENVIHNAIKFTERGSVAISARFCNGVTPVPTNGLPPDGSSESAHCTAAPAADHSYAAQAEVAPTFVEFKVSDTGVGIPRDAIPFIFNKFRQADSSQTREFGGMGLGLYIVKSFTDLLGGAVRVDTELGKGSTFTVCIPTAR